VGVGHLDVAHTAVHELWNREIKHVRMGIIWGKL